MKNDTPAVFLFIIGLVAVHLSAFLLPGSLTWGFHFLVFLGPPYPVLYLVVVASLLFLARKDILERGIARASSAMAKRQTLFLLSSVAIFLGAGFLFRMGVPLLGDSWFLVKNFSQVLSGAGPLYPRNEPLATYYYSTISGVMGIKNYGDFLDSFFVADMMMGAGFVIILFFIVKELSAESEGRFAAFLLAAFLPSSYFFFGYVETYAPVCFMVSLYLLAGLLFVRHRIPFTVVILVFLLQTFTHYLTLLLVPSLLYLACRGIRRGRTADILVGSSIAAVLIFGGLLITGAGIRDLYSQVPHTHYLPFNVPGEVLEEYSFPYTLFSVFHFVDIVNLVILLAPASIFLFVTAYINRRRGRGQTVRTPVPAGVRFLAWGVLPVVLFILIAKFDLGAARDWDVAAPFSFLFALAAVSYYLCAVPGRPGVRVAGLLAGITLCNSVLWFSLNASDEAALERYHSLLDRRIVSQVGFYTAHLSLSMFYHQTGLGKGTPADLWEGYIREYPDDTRGYMNVIANMKDSSEERLLGRFARWKEAAAGRVEIRNALFTAYAESADPLMGEGSLDRARILYEAALGIDPGSAPVCNNLGILRAHGGDMAGAVEMFERTIALDSTYAEAYFNLGRACSATGKRDRARWAFGESARRGNTDARAYLEREGPSRGK